MRDIALEQDADTVAMTPDEALRLVAPSVRVGSVWCWEPLADHARAKVVVTAVEWNGEEWVVESESPDGRRHWNDLTRWVEATVLVDPAEHIDGSGAPK